MAKQSGLGDNLYVAGYDVSGDIGAIKSVACPQGVIEVTGIDKSAYERLGGQRDGSIEFTAFFNKSAGQAHQVFKSLPDTDTQVQYWRGTTIGAPVAAMVAKQITYDGERTNEGALTFGINASANGYGLDWGVGLTAGKRTDTAATNGATLDQTTVSTSFGWQAHLQVFGVTGTSATVTIQDSADGVSWATLSGAVFTAATGVTHQRLQAASATATVRRYVRAITTGTFTSAVFAVHFTRNLTAVTF